MVLHRSLKFINSSCAASEKVFWSESQNYRTVQPRQKLDGRPIQIKQTLEKATKAAARCPIHVATVGADLEVYLCKAKTWNLETTLGAVVGHNLVEEQLGQMHHP